MLLKLWDSLITRAIPERLVGVITTRRYTNPRLPLPSSSFVHKSRCHFHSHEVSHSAIFSLFSVQLWSFTPCELRGNCKALVTKGFNSRSSGMQYINCFCVFNSQLQPHEDDRMTFTDSPAASAPSSGRNTPAQISDAVILTNCTVITIIVIDIVAAIVHCCIVIVEDVSTERWVHLLIMEAWYMWVCLQLLSEGNQLAHSLNGCWQTVTHLWNSDSDLIPMHCRCMGSFKKWIWICVIYMLSQKYTTFCSKLLLGCYRPWHLSLFGHIACMDDSADGKMILTAPPP